MWWKAARDFSSIYRIKDWYRYRLTQGKVEWLMEDSKKWSYKEILPIVFTALGLIEVIVSAVILVSTFYGQTSLSGQLVYHAIIAVVWLATGFVVYQMDWAGFAYVFIAILMLLASAFILCTIYTMTDYIVKSAEKSAYIIINKLI